MTRRKMEVSGPGERKTDRQREREHTQGERRRHKQAGQNTRGKQNHKKKGEINRKLTISRAATTTNLPPITNQIMLHKKEINQVSVVVTEL